MEYPVARIAQLFASAKQRMGDALREAHSENLKQGLEIARRWSSGPASLRTLQRLGHPYRRGGSGLGDPALINRQTGTFLRAWRAEPPRVSGGNIFGRLINTAPQAGMLQAGTSRMMRRPIREKVLQILRPAAFRRLKAAARAALKP